MSIDLASLADTVTNSLSDGVSNLLNVLSDPTTLAASTTAGTTAATTATTSTSAVTGTGLSLFVKTAPVALITAHPLAILAALGGGLGIIGIIDAVSDFREGKSINLENPLKPERVQKA